MRILLLEDEESIRGFVRINLKRNDMEVIEAENGEDALEFADKEGPFDIALLDVMLPTISGFEVCERLRERYPGMGIIMLTAKSQEEDKIYGLELGADDYVQKPFSPGELIARIKSLYRRMNAGAAAMPEPPESAQSEGSRSDRAQRPAEAGGTERSGGVAAHRSDAAGDCPALEGEAGAERSPAAEPPAAQEPRADAGDAPPTAAPPAHGGERDERDERGGRQREERYMVSGPFRLSVSQRKLWKEDAEIVLTPTEWTLVRLLMEREGESVSRDHILSEVWGRYYVGDLKVVDVNIRRIRQKIECNPSAPSVIETVWGFGYRWKRSVRQ